MRINLYDCHTNSNRGQFSIYDPHIYIIDASMNFMFYILPIYIYILEMNKKQVNE